MTQHDGFTEQLEQWIADETKHLAAGRVDTLDEYRMRCGKIAGYRRALDEYRAFLDRQQHDD